MEESLCANLSIQKEYFHLLKMSEHTAEHFFFNIVVAKTTQILCVSAPHN